MMIGRDLEIPSTSRPPAAGRPRLELRSLSVASEHAFGRRFARPAWRSGPGEIVGIAGVAGNGQSELLAALSGEKVPAPEADMIRIDGRPVGRSGPGRRRDLGLA